MGRFSATAGAVAACMAAMGATPPTHTLPGVKLATPPTIDGVVDTQVEWAKAPSGSGFVDQMTAQRAAVETQFWLAYDDKYIYFAAKMQDPNPKGIKATAYQPNVSMMGDDSVTLEIDPFGNLVDFNGFQMNAKGATKIMTTSGRAAKYEWAGEFVAKGRVTAEGWEVEARIPWAIMSLPAAGRRTLRVDILRYHAGSDRYSGWSSAAGWSPEEVGRWVGVDLPRIVTPRTLKLLPFGYLGAVQGGAGIADGGLDMKTALTDQLQLVGSIKPDFRNIEQQILSLDFTHYQQIVKESRPFFMEGAYDMDQAGAGPFLFQQAGLFVSQSIPDFDVGMKMYGKLNDKTTVGVFDANTLGRSNASVASAMYSLDHVSRVSVTGTSYEAGGEHNEAGSVTLNRQFGPLFLMGSAAGSDDAVNGRGSDLGGMAYFQKGSWFGLGAYQEVSRTFDPALGYVPYVDFKGASGIVSYDAVLPRGNIREIMVGANGWNYLHYDGTPFYNSFNPNVTVTSRNGTALTLGVTEDRYQGIDEHLYNAVIGKQMSDPNRNWSLSTNWGDQLGMYYFSSTLGTAYRPIQHLQLGLSYQYVDMKGVSDQAILTVKYEMGLYNSISGRAVEKDGHWNVYAAFNRTGNRGPEYYVIVGDPNALDFRASLIFKVTVPFEIKL